jgi:hypothetical protein
MANPFQQFSAAFPGLGLNAKGFSNSAKKLGIALLVSLITGCLSFYIGQAQALGTFAHWRSLGKPPEPAVKIVGTTLGSVTVETTSARNYECEIDKTSECWSETKTEGSIDNHLCSPKAEPTEEINDAIDFQKACYLSPGEYTVSAYALRGDGNIYVWEQTTMGEGIWVVLLFCPLAGWLAGFLGMLAFFFLRWIAKGV